MQANTGSAILYRFHGIASLTQTDADAWAREGGDRTGEQVIAQGANGLAQHRHARLPPTRAVKAAFDPRDPVCDRTGTTQAATSFENRSSFNAFQITGAKTGAWLTAIDEDRGGVIAEHSREKENPPTTLSLGCGRDVVTAARGSDSLAAWTDGAQIRGALLRCR